MTDTKEKRIRITAASLAALIVAAVCIPFKAYAMPVVSAKSAVVMNAESGEILFEKNSDEHCDPSSTAKIMTGLIACEDGNFDSYVTMSYNAIWNFDRKSNSHIALDEDETLKFGHLVYGMMLMSANECALGIAEAVSGSTDVFVKKMNERAKKCGAVNTNFTTPHGLFNENQYTTAKDMGLITCEAIKNEKFTEVMSTHQYTIPPTNKQKDNRIFNHSHKMMPGREKYYSGVVGGKTAYTEGSGYALVTYAKQGGIELVIVLFGESTEADSYKDTANLLDYYFSNFEVRNFSVNDYLTGSVTSVELESAGVVRTVCKGNVSVLFEKNVDIGDVKCTVIPDNSVTLPIMEGTKVGTVRFMLDGRYLGEAPLFAAETMYVRSDEEISDNIPEKKKDKSLFSSNKSTFVKILILIGYIMLVALIVIIMLAIIALCVRRQNIRKLQRRRMTRKRMKNGDSPFKDIK